MMSEKSFYNLEFFMKKIYEIWIEKISMILYFWLIIYHSKWTISSIIWIYNLNFKIEIWLYARKLRKYQELEWVKKWVN